MRALVLAVFGWASAVVANFHNVDVSPGSGDADISFYGNWTTTSDDCGPAFVASTIGDGLAYSFQGAAVYVYGTVACGWQGLLSISVDGVYNTTINRCNCDVIPTGGPNHICRFPWLAKDGLDPTVEHTLSLMLVGPTLAENPSGNVIAELRSIRYTFPNQSSSVDASPTDDDGDDDDEPTSSTTVPTPSVTAENADAPLPQLASLHLSTAATCGIIIGVILFFLSALLACVVLRRRSQQRRRRQQQAATMANVMAGPRSGMVSQGRARYPTEHLSWSPAAERLEARTQQASSQSGRRNSGGRSSWGSGSGRHGGRRSRMDSIPETDWEHSDQRMAATTTTPADEEKGGFSWAGASGSSPPSPTGSETRRESERVVYTSSDRAPSTTRVTFPSIAAAGDYWNRRTSRGSGRFSTLPPSPLRTSLVPEDDGDGRR